MYPRFSLSEYLTYCESIKYMIAPYTLYLYFYKFEPNELKINRINDVRPKKMSFQKQHIICTNRITYNRFIVLDLSQIFYFFLPNSSFVSTLDVSMANRFDSLSK